MKEEEPKLKKRSSTASKTNSKPQHVQSKPNNETPHQNYRDAFLSIGGTVKHGKPNKKTPNFIDFDEIKTSKKKSAQQLE